MPQTRLDSAKSNCLLSHHEGQTPRLDGLNYSRRRHSASKSVPAHCIRPMSARYRPRTLFEGPSKPLLVHDSSRTLQRRHRVVLMLGEDCGRYFKMWKMFPRIASCIRGNQVAAVRVDSHHRTRSDSLITGRQRIRSTILLHSGNGFLYRELQRIIHFGSCRQTRVSGAA